MSNRTDRDKPGYEGDKAAHLKRIRRIEGQVRGIARMVEDDKYCIDVLTQVAAVNKAMHSVAVSLLADHMNHCVVNAARSSKVQGEVKVTEAVAAIERLLKA